MGIYQLFFFKRKKKTFCISSFFFSTFIAHISHYLPLPSVSFSTSVFSLSSTLLRQNSFRLVIDKITKASSSYQFNHHHHLYRLASLSSEPILTFFFQNKKSTNIYFCFSYRFLNLFRNRRFGPRATFWVNDVSTIVYKDTNEKENKRKNRLLRASSA